MDEFVSLEMNFKEIKEKSKEVEKEFDEASRTIDTLCKRRTSGMRKDEMFRLMKKVRILRAEMDKVEEERRKLIDKLLKLRDLGKMKHGGMKPTVAEPKDVVDVIEVKEEADEQVGPGPSTLQALMVDDSHKDVADVVEVEDELDEQVGPGPSTSQASVMDDSGEDVEDADMIEEELVEQVEPGPSTLQALGDEPHENFAEVTMMEEELYEQAAPGSEALQTLMRTEDTRLEILHEDMARVSIEHLGDGPHAGMGKKMTSFPIPWRTFPRMTMMEPCTLEKQGEHFLL